MLKKIKKLIKNPGIALLILLETPLGYLLSDKAYLKLKYRLSFGKKLNLKNPKTFNEKMQYLKLYDRNPINTMFVDKYKVRDYIAKELGEEYLIPLLGAWDNADEIDFSALPEQFVLKCNHNSGLGMCICKDKSKLDFAKVKKELCKGLKQNYYIHGREWPYKDVPRKIIAEKYMVDESGDELKDYKLWCFDGKVRVILTCAERFSKSGLRENFYDADWNLLDLQRPTHKNTDYQIPRPQNLEKMLNFAEKLSSKMPFLRVDFYEVRGDLYFGELTFFPTSGFEKFVPEEWDLKLGEWLNI